MITDISIQNLRGIKKCEIHNLGQVNVLIGKNSAGKSTILESIQLVSSVMFYPTEQISIIVNRRSDRSWHPRELWYKYDLNFELSVSLLFDNKNHLHMTAHKEATDRDPESIGFYISDISTDKPIKVRQFDREQMRNRERGMYRSQVTLKPDRTQISKIKLPEDILSFLVSVTLIDPIGKTQTNVFEEEFQDIKFSGKYNETVGALKQAYDEKMQSWELFRYFSNTNENRTAFMYEGQPVYVDDLGDGVKYGFAAITIAHNRHDTVLLMEEIETHQHSSSLRKLVEFLVKIAKENHLQIFVSTQSPDVLRYFKKTYPETKVFLIEKDPTKDIVYANDEEDSLKIFREVGWDIENLLQYQRIAIVDGTEDEIIIEDFFKKTRGYPLGSEGIGLFPIRGGQKKFGEIVRTLVTSSREIIAIKDLDEMKNHNDVLTLVISWLKSLEGEGWNVHEDEQQVIGSHPTSGKTWKILKSNILKAGNIAKFPKYKKHSITDYLLEAILDHPDQTSEFGLKQDISNYELKADSSKEELEFLLGTYNMDSVKRITQAVSKNMIPNSINDDIIKVL